MGRRGQAGVCNSLTFVTDNDERAEFKQGLELARQSGAVETERACHSWSVPFCVDDSLRQPKPSIWPSRGSRRRVMGRAATWRGLTSLGRLHRAHSHRPGPFGISTGIHDQQALDDHAGMIRPDHHGRGL